MLFAVSILGAVTGAILAVAAYLTPDTGVDGTTGAMLAVLGSVVLPIGIFLSARSGPRARWWLAALTVITGVLTAIAAYFLMQNLLMAAVLVALLAFLIHLFTGPRRVTA